MLRQHHRDESNAQPGIRQPASVPGLPAPAAAAYLKTAGFLLLLHGGLSILLRLVLDKIPVFSDLFSGNTLRSFVLSGTLTQLVLVLLPTVIMLMVVRPPASDLVGGRAKAGSLILATTVGIPAAVVFQGLNNLLIFALARAGIRINIPMSSSSFSFSGDLLLSQPWTVWLVVLLLAVVLPGLTEELMFRGLLQGALRSGCRPAAAIIWQALAFAVFHADPLFLLPPFLAGALLGYIRHKSESLLPSVLAHMTLNFSLLAIRPLLPHLTSQYISSSASQAQSLLYASLIAAFVAAVAFIPLLVLIGHRQPDDQFQSGSGRRWLPGWIFFAALLLLTGGLYLQSI